MKELSQSYVCSFKCRQELQAHFYEQGKADAVKDVINSSKNISDSTKARSASDR
jgi:hypothetical protein